MTGLAADEVIQLAEVGFRLFPCTPKKTPRFKGWQQSASSDLAKAQALARANTVIGARTGITFDVFDIEYEFLDAIAGAIAAFRGPVARTGGGGVHLYVRSAQRLRNHDLVLNGQKVGDVRGQGGLVIVPPSRSTKGPYEWIKPPWSAPLPEPTADLIDLVKFPRKPIAKPGSGTSEDLARLAATVAHAPEGKRNNVLFWAACKAYEGGLPPRAVEPVLLGAAREADYPEGQALATIRSAEAHV